MHFVVDVMKMHSVMLTMNDKIWKEKKPSV